MAEVLCSGAKGAEPEDLQQLKRDILKVLSENIERCREAQALADALNAGHLAGAGADVLSSEPPSPDNPLPTAKNCFVTPHVAWATLAARRRLLSATVANLHEFLNGNTTNVVNGV